MSMMPFNEFQRELRRAGIEGATAYMMTMMYEQIIELGKQGEEQSKLLLALANTVGDVVDLHAVTKGHVEALAKFGKTDGIDVSSVAPEPEKD